MLFTANRPLKLRYVEFKDGQFVSKHQTKASSHLTSQIDNQNTFNEQSDEPLAGVSTSNQDNQSVTVFEECLPSKWFQGFQLFFFFLLVAMAVLIINLSQNFWNDTQAYLSTEEVLSIQPTESEVIVIPSNEAQLTDLTHILHTHHATNELYESVKTVVRDYFSGEISAGERNVALTKLLTETNQLIAYNETRLKERLSSDSQPLYELNDARLTQLKHLIQELNEVPYRGRSIEQLNKGIQQDQLLFKQQLEAFKTLLEQQQIPYAEKDGRLYFSFSE